MQQTLPDTTLSEYQCATVVLRLVLNDRGQVSHGEFVDVMNADCMRFSGWRGMLRVGKTWLQQQQGNLGNRQTDRRLHPEG